VRLGALRAHLRPLFLLSLPRAGSTLVQRVLGAHPEIATVSEPWLLLAPLYALRSGGMRAEYWQETASEALEDFCRELDGGSDDYRAALGRFALELYRGAAGHDATFFLDKTPRYHTIASELPRLFPDARFIVLWRNPLAVLSSLLSTFRDARFEPYLFEIDLFAGVANLAGFADMHQNLQAVRYEDLVGGDAEAHWAQLFGFLDLDFDPEILTRFGQVELRGRYGDPTATLLSSISAQNLDKWRASLDGTVRVAWCRRWLDWIGRDRLALMGYDFDVLGTELASLACARPVWRDLLHLGSSWTSARLKAAALAWPDSPRPRGGIFSG
jgi:hypothetical protein